MSARRPPRTEEAAAPQGRRDRRGALRASWSGLTARGGSFLSAGVVALSAAAVLRQVDLVRIALLLLALPLAALLVMVLLSLHVTVTRETQPSRAFAGLPVTVTVVLVNRGRRRTPTLLVEDGVPATLGVNTRVVAPPMPVGAMARLSYRVNPGVRGRYVLGPARVHAGEPFGMLERTWRAAGTDEFLVRPRPLPLVQGLRPGSARGEAETSAGALAAAGVIDMSVREYRDGDDLRRVHWASTARRGSLMVRRDERPEEPRLTILLDRREGAHSPDGASFEWAVVAAASIAAHEETAGQEVTLRCSDCDPVTGLDEILDRLATLTVQPEDSLARALAPLQSWSGGTLVAVMGAVRAVDASALAGVGQGARRAALVAPGGQARAASYDAAIGKDHLDDVGWRFVQARPGDTVPMAWHRLCAEVVGARGTTWHGAGAGALS